MPRATRIPESTALRALFDSYTVPQLKPLARLLEPGLPTRKFELLDRVTRHLTDPHRLRELWESLDLLQQAAVVEVLHAGGPFDASRFQAKYGESPNWGEQSYGRLKRPSLLRLFLPQDVLPDELRPLLKAFVPPPRAPRVQTVDQPQAAVTHRQYDHVEGKSVAVEVPVVCLETERAAQYDLLAVLRLIDAGKIRASAKTMWVTAAGARAIAKILYGGDYYPPDMPLQDWGDTAVGPIKAFAWPLIVQSAGLVELAGTRLQLTAAGSRALRASPHHVLRGAWGRWLGTTLLDEFRRIDLIKGQTGKGRRGMTAVADRRATIAAALSECPTGEWIAVDEFSRYMRASGHTFEVTHDLFSLYIYDHYYGHLGYTGRGGWSIVQKRYILAFLFEYAATMGLIDVAYLPPAGVRDDWGDMWGTDDLNALSRYDGLLAFRINGLGAWCLGQADEYVPAPFAEHPALKVLPNMEVVAVEALPPSDVLYLEGFAEPTADRVWAIRREKVLEALEGGERADEIISFLRAKSVTPLSENVVANLAEWGDRASRLALCGPALWIEVQDAALAQLVANDSRTRSLCMLAGERHLVVPAEAEIAFRRALHELGYGLAGTEGEGR
jgi:hypothetical protein